MNPTGARLDRRYSDDAATAVPWARTQARLAAAEVAWIVTVRPDGRPHATPMVPVVHNGHVYFHTGNGEVKYANIQANPRVLVLAGDTGWAGGLDVTVDGTASAVSDVAVLRQLAGRYVERWDGRWQLDVDGIVNGTSNLVVFEVVPTNAYGYAKGDLFSHTTYRYDPIQERSS